ncbi:MAG: ECF transporter S component, partial [Actinomycetota bacterium]
GFTLGAVGIFASDLFIGLGRGTPFVMVALGWVGAGAGLLPKGSWPVRIGVLALYGFVVGFVFGMLTNMWSWPFLTQGSGISWVPGASTSENLQNYATFYVATSLGWDAFRAVGNTILVLVLGRPLLGALDRAAKRMRLDIKPVILRHGGTS